MATNKQILNKFGLTLWMAAFVVMPNVSSAAPGTLASVPLFTAANADPNILFHLDSSGSMNHVMVESTFEGTATYNSAATYDADPDDGILDVCSAASGGGGLIPAGDLVKLTIDTGVPKINYGGTDYDLGNDAAETEKCFDPNEKYLARLTLYSTLPIGLIYSGHYLNWYFTPGNTTGTWGSWGTATQNNRKPQTRNRSDVAKASLVSLVGSLNNVRVGASSFNGTAGASIDEEIDDIGASGQRQATIDAINAKPPGGGTPLAESLQDIGRYFSNSHATGTSNCGGTSGAKLILHPGGITGTENTTTNCTSILGNTNAVKDLTGPIKYQCQSNFVILTTDGLASDDTNISAHLQDYDGDCSGTAETDGGYTCVNPNNASDPHYDMKDTGTYTTNSNASDYLDDVALALYDMDLRPDLDDAANNEVTNNIRTYVVGFADESVKNNQLLTDTAAQGGGEYIYADNAGELETAFGNATSAILNLIGSAAAVTFNTATLGANSAVYLALFNSSSWSGDLVAYDLNETSGNIEGSTWSAAAQLDALSDAAAVSDRVILTYNGAGGIPFRWPASYPTLGATEFVSAQVNDLLVGVPVGASNAVKSAAGQARVDFLRGDTSKEGSPFRSRTSRLGDIVHAGPVFVGAPELNWPDGDGSNGFPLGTSAYSIYKFNKSTDTDAGRANRPGVVYVGSNDGMLHGFATEDGTLGSAGDEVLAYAPRALFSTVSTRGYHYLTQSSYNHQYYVDLIPTISDIYDATNGWRTILVGGLRGGGRGFYALNVTDPASFSETGTNPDNIVLGEFTNTDEPDLGYTFSRPTIAMMENGRWAAIVGNGYNPDTTLTSTTMGEASLLIIYLDGNPDDGWTEGTGTYASTEEYRKIPTGVGDTSTLNGLSTPTLIDTDGNGKVDRAYAGDLLGNMWAFDLIDTDATNWAVATSSGGGSTPTPLFAAGSNQPITSQPEVVLNSEVATSNANKPNVLVLFGTGQYVSSADNAYTISTPLGDQAFYGVWDAGTGNVVKANLTEQTIDAESGGLRTVSSNAVAYAETGGSKNFGWYIDLNTNSDGERVVTDAVVRGDIVYFNTAIPSGDTCSFGGTGYQMSVQYLSGANPVDAIFDADGNGTISNDSPYSGVAFEQGLPAAPSFLSDRRYTPGTRSKTGSEVVDDVVEKIGGMGTGRLSWEELFQK